MHEHALPYRAGDGRSAALAAAPEGMTAPVPRVQALLYTERLVGDAPGLRSAGPERPPGAGAAHASAARTVSLREPCGYERVAASPDGRRVAYWDFVTQSSFQWHLFVAAADGTSPRPSPSRRTTSTTRTGRPTPAGSPMPPATASTSCGQTARARPHLAQHAARPPHDAALVPGRTPARVPDRQRRRGARPPLPAGRHGRGRRRLRVVSVRALARRPERRQRARRATGRIEQAPARRHASYGPSPGRPATGTWPSDTAPDSRSRRGPRARCVSSTSPASTPGRRRSRCWRSARRTGCFWSARAVVRKRCWLGSRRRDLAWAPDGRSLAYLACGVCGSPFWRDRDLRIASVGGIVHTVVPTSGRAGGSITDLEWTRTPVSVRYRPVVPRVVALPIPTASRHHGRSSSWPRTRPSAYASCGHVFGGRPRAVKSSKPARPRLRLAAAPRTTTPATGSPSSPSRATASPRPGSGREHPRGGSARPRSRRARR